ncbi:terminase small subunit [Rummeliibacillus sp. TYF-LIM-RU47]|uniref:terminase small subunit n=1 Tax=Rummeliibacillus sp. TYF-LIM-RU47 TaxID=2608406 RepID=UPI001CC22244|nr:terminase small subunit [Rummeliibacillus sp. TYF-LIM-RU47]
MVEKYELAKVDYDNGMKYKDIAKKYDVTINTVKSWKTRKWNKIDSEVDEKSVHTKQRCVHTKNKASPNKKYVKKEPCESEIVVREDNDLTDKQRLFVAYYVKCWNATKAYQRAYECAYTTAMVEGSRHLKKPKIRDEIVRVRDEITNEALLSKQVLIQKWIDIAFADVTEYMTFGTEEEIVYEEDGFPKIDANGNIVKQAYSYVRLADSTHIDGTLIAEVKQGRDGITVKLADKMKALEYLSKHMDLLDEKQLKQLKKEKAKLEIEKTKSEIDKLKADISKDDDQPIEIVIKRKGER